MNLLHSLCCSCTC